MSYNTNNLYTHEEEQEIVKIFMELADQYNVRDKMEEIIYKGTYKNNKFDTNLCINNTECIEMERRFSIAFILLTTPKTLDKLVDNKVCLFHGTTSIALPGIIKSGLNSLRESKSNNLEITTAETWSIRGQFIRDIISFTDDISLAEFYSNNYELKKVEGSFPIIIGINKSFIDKTCTQEAYGSDLCEVGIKKHIDLKDISTMLVPSDKVKIVKKMIDDNNIEVLGLDFSKNKFFGISEDDYGNELGVILNPDKLAMFKEELETNRKSFSFSLDEIRNFVKNNILAKTNNKESRDINEPIYK